MITEGRKRFYDGTIVKGEKNKRTGEKEGM
jgi:hypothetical protein